MCHLCLRMRRICRGIDCGTKAQSRMVADMMEEELVTMEEEKDKLAQQKGWKSNA